MRISKWLTLKRSYFVIFICGIFIISTSGTNVVFGVMDENIDNGVKVDGYYEYKHPFIQELAQNITKNIKGTKKIKIVQNLKFIQNLKNPTRLEICKAVFIWMHNNVVYEKPMYFNSKHYAVETAKLSRGNCCDQARLFIALCRAAGIPHNAIEFNYSGAVQFAGENIYGHVWPVVTLENGSQIICDTSSKSSTFGHPTWKNKGSISESYDLKL